MTSAMVFSGDDAGSGDGDAGTQPEALHAAPATVHIVPIDGDDATNPAAHETPVTDVPQVTVRAPEASTYPAGMVQKALHPLNAAEFHTPVPVMQAVSWDASSVPLTTAVPVYPPSHASELAAGTPTEPQKSESGPIIASA